MNKVLHYTDLNSHITNIRERGSIVLVGGCFDIIHPGHIEFLKKAKNEGDQLFVLLESDESITAWKGKGRPVNTQEKRASALAQIPYVDFILLLPRLKTDQKYYEMTNLIRPDIIAVTKGDPATSKKAQQAKQVGGKLIEVIERIPNHSTTSLINKT
ncbi:MAG: adenylyltransferase/cytidyltransferase family protein [Candidatus Levybacteria bacterium]|nr:adenylyltransferase/cytidyltransferase family protein [Candidatus Levybacteria bacterium]